MRNRLFFMLLFIVIMLAAAGCGTRLYSDGPAAEGESTKSSLFASEGDMAPEESELTVADESADTSVIAESQPLTRHGGPAPRYLSFDIEPEYTEYKIGETIEFRIKLTNESDKELHIANEPKLRVGLATSSTKLAEVAVPALADLTLEPGKSLNTTAEWKQHGKTGQYRVELGEVDLGTVKTSGGGQTFFVDDPNEQMMQGSIVGSGEAVIPNDQITEKSTITVHHIEFTDHETIVQFDIHTTQTAPLGFHASLVRDGDTSQAETALSLEQSENIDGIISATLKFNPSPIDTKHLKLLFTSWDVVHAGEGVVTYEGPWSIELPLDNLH